MPVSLSEFRERFPEFDRASDTLVVGRIAEAERRTPADVWGALEDDGIAYLAAHLLSLLPQSRDMRVEGFEDLYSTNRRRLARAVVGGFRVVG